MGENQRSLHPLSLMVRKFLEYKASEDAQLPLACQARSPRSSETGWPQTPYSESYFFFYGTLMDSAILAKVLHLLEPP
jgi:hypothetical protein